MSGIYMGPGAINRASALSYPSTFIDGANPANDSGIITSIELWFNTNATGVKVATFSKSGSTFTARSVATIGNITAGSKQTFTGLNLFVMIGDYIGYHSDTGDIEADTSGGVSVWYKDGDGTGGAGTYYDNSGYAISIYAIGIETFKQYAIVFGV